MPIVNSRIFLHTNDIERLDFPLEDCPLCGADSVLVVRDICNRCNERNMRREGNKLFVVKQDEKGNLKKQYVKDCDGSCQEHYISSKSYSVGLRCTKCNHRWMVTKRLL
jgi:hypothetical protein